MTTERKHCRLADLPVNVPATVVKYGDLSEKEVQTLRDLGLVLGCTVKVLTVATEGPLLVGVSDARMAVNREVAAQVKVLI